MDADRIIDAAIQASREVHRQDEIKRLRDEISQIGKVCGDCDHWMKSRECPRERNIKGISCGPSMNESICGSFKESASAAERRSMLVAQRAAIQRQETE